MGIFSWLSDAWASLTGGETSAQRKSRGRLERQQAQQAQQQAAQTQQTAAAVQQRASEQVAQEERGQAEYNRGGLQWGSVREQQLARARMGGYGVSEGEGSLDEYGQAALRGVRRKGGGGFARLFGGYS